VKAIAEKMNTMIPGIYDASVYDDDDDDEWNVAWSTHTLSFD
jgi:hypothetical protein